VPVAIDALIKRMEAVNVVDLIQEEEDAGQILQKIGNDVLDGYRADWDSMLKWRDDVSEGLELIEPATDAKSEPWEGASNFKTPLIMEARLKFGDRASEELLGNDELVRGKAFGDDRDGEKEKRVERVTAVMNWQLTVEEEDWIDQQDKLLYNLAVQGTQFKKVFFDPTVGHNVSEVISFPDFAVNQSCKSYKDLPRFTHRIFKKPSQINTLVAAGIWCDKEYELGTRTTEDEDADGNRLVEATNDKTTEFFEQQCWIDLDHDDIDEPYIVTVHATSGTVVRIVAHMAIDGVHVQNVDGVVRQLSELVQKDEEGNAIINEETDEVLFSDDIDDWFIIKIDRDENIVPYEFITNPQGELLSVGYFHLLGAYAQSINGNTNRLQDAGTLANQQSGFMARGFRARMGEMKIKPGTYNQTNLSSQDLQNGIREFNFKEPSPTLHALTKEMTADAQRLGATADLGAAIGPNTPAATVLSIVHEQQQSVGAIILRVWRAMTKEFRIRFRLNAKFMDPQLYATLLDTDNADAMADFSTSDMDVMPTANPKNNSLVQRMQKAEAEMSIFDRVLQTGGNPTPLVKGYLLAIGSDKVEEVFPTLSPEEQQQQEQEQERIKQLEEQLKYLPVKAQADLGEAEKMKGQATMMQAQAAQQKAMSDMQSAQFKDQNVQMDTVKKQAEVEKIMTEVDGENLEIDMIESGVADLLEERARGPR
jgi:hypothetical protein